MPAKTNKAIKTDAARTGDSFANFITAIGYGTANVSSGGTYGIDYLSRNRQRLESLYRSSWIAGKAIDTVAEDMTKKGIEISSVVDPGKVEEVTVLWRDLKVWDNLCDTVKWARLYGGAIGVILIDGQKPETPLRVETVGKDQFKGILPLDRWLVQPSLGNLVKEYGPEFGLPVSYDVIGGAAMGIPTMKVHYSRVVRIIGQDLPYWQRQAEMLWGQSVIERLFDRLLAFDSTTQGTAQLVYKAHLRTYKIKGLREIIAAGGPALKGLLKQIEMIRATQSNEGMTLMDLEDEFEAHQYTFAGLDDVLLQISQQLSGALDIPLVKLLGQSPAGLNATGESDLINYYDGIHLQQERRLRFGVGKLLNVSYRSKFGVAPPKGFDFQFRSLWQMSDTDKATIFSTIATGITQLYNSNIIDQQTALKEVRQSSHVTNIGTNVSDELIEKASDELEQSDELSVIGNDENEDMLGAGGGKAKDAETTNRGNEQITFAGFPVTIEYRKGVRRTLVNTAARVVYDRIMQYDYGFLNDTLGVDGDEVDVILGPNQNAPKAWAIEMIDLGPDVDKREDEFKIALGFENHVAAEDSFLSMYPRTFLGRVSEMSVAEFRSALERGEFGKLERATAVA